MDFNLGLSRLRAFALNILALIVSLIVVLLLLEGMVRIVGLESASFSSISGFTEYDSELGWNLVPDRKTVFRGEHFSAVVETSEQGLRDRFYPLKPESGRRRILVIGDSVVWCWGVEIDECFTKRIERELPDTDVITMGVPGFATSQELLLYERDGRKFQPDLVLLVFVGNDPAENLVGHKRPRFRLVGDELVVTNQPVSRRKSAIKELAEKHSRLYVQVKYGARIAGLLIRSWGDTASSGSGSTASSGKNIYVQPHRSEKIEALSLTKALIKRFHNSVSGDGARLVVAMTASTDFFKSSLHDLCKQIGCLTFDLDPPIREAKARGVEVRLKGDPHLSSEGQAVMAKQILNWLQTYFNVIRENEH